MSARALRRPIPACGAADAAVAIATFPIFVPNPFAPAAGFASIGSSSLHGMLMQEHAYRFLCPNSYLDPEAGVARLAGTVIGIAMREPVLTVFVLASWKVVAVKDDAS